MFYFLSFNEQMKDVIESNNKQPKEKNFDEDVYDDMVSYKLQIIPGVVTNLFIFAIRSESPLADSGLSHLRKRFILNVIVVK